MFWVNRDADNIAVFVIVQVHYAFTCLDAVEPNLVVPCDENNPTKVMLSEHAY